MPKYQIVLTAQGEKGCPLYQKGDRMVLSLPAVDMFATDKVCAFVIAQFLAKGVQKEGSFDCRGIPNFASKAAYQEAFGIEESTFCPACQQIFSVSLEEKVEDYSQLPESRQFTMKSDKNTLLAKLKRIPLFSVVKPEDLFDMLPEIEFKRCQAGEIVIRKGQPGKYLFVIYEGEVEIIHSSKDGSESVIAQLKEGECFGEMSLLTGDPVSATIRACSPCRLLLISSSLFREVMAKTASWGIMFTKLLAERIKTTNQRMSMVVAAGMAGQLQTIRFPELVQTLCTMECNGILSLAKQGKRACVYFQNGQIIDVTIEGGRFEQDAIERFYSLLKWESGAFRFEPKETDQERTIFADPMSLLLEGLRRMDEETRQFHPSDFPL